MDTFIQACALALAIEGIGFALFPEGMAKAMLEMSQLSPQALRWLGVAALSLSALLAFLLKFFR